jgi:integrase
MRIPQDLVDVIGVREIQKSLRTNQISQARSIASAYHLTYSNAFLKLRVMRIAGSNTEELRRVYNGLVEAKVGNQRIKAASLSDIVRKYTEERGRSWAPMTKRLNEATAELMHLVLGDPPIDQITRDEVRKFRNILLEMPIHAQRICRGKPIEEMLALDRPKLNPKTVNRNMNFVCSLLSWSQKEGYSNSNPASGLRLMIKGEASRERKAFDDRTLDSLLRRLLEDRLKDHQRLVPIIGLYSGMRIEEIAQLRLKDVREIDGILCFDVTSEAGSLKSDSSRRVVPVHENLMNNGLLSYIERLHSQKHTRLWPNLVPDKYGRRSSALSKWFGRYKRRIGIDDPKLTFHSLRHTFVNKLKQVDVSEPIIASLVGQKNSSVTLNRYGKAYKVQVLSEAVNRISIDL